MYSRVRSKNTASYVTRNATTGNQISTSFDQIEYLSDNTSRYIFVKDNAGGASKRFRSKFNPVKHTKCTKPNLKTVSQWGVPANYTRNYFNSNLVHNSAGPSIVTSIIPMLYAELDFQKDNSFDFIQSIVDLDKTIAIFTKKFWKSLSYGAVNWGVLPFISDIKSFIGTVQTYNGLITDSYAKYSGKRITRRNSGTFNYVFDGEISYRCEWVATLSGYIDLGYSPPSQPIDTLAILADELGLNFDAKAIWDVIPLSFVLDYFVPIGDSLESLHPRGWFTPKFLFTGGVSFKLKLTAFGTRADTTFSEEYSYFERRLLSTSIPSRKTKTPDFSAPTLKNLFDVGYLASRRFKK